MNENRNGAAATAPPAAMDPSLDGRHQDPRSIGDLIRELADEGRSLLRSEVSLVKAELTEKVHVYERKTSKIAIGGARGHRTGADRHHPPRRRPLGKGPGETWLSEAAIRSSATSSERGRR